MIGASTMKKTFRFVEATPGVMRCLVMRSDLPRVRSDHEELVVIGTGPSLRPLLTDQIGFFEGKRTMCVNEFAHSDYFARLKPEYYVLTDPAYWRKGQHPEMDAMIRKSVAIMRATAWKMTLLINAAGRDWNYFKELPQENPNIDIAYFNNNGVSCPESLRYFLYKKSRAMPLLHNTLSVGIFLGLNMGFKTVYVVGADHNWHEDIHITDDNTLHWRLTHFTDDGKAALEPMWTNGFKTKTFRMHQILHSLSLTFAGYVELEEYSRYLGARVYNASGKSYIDAFERRSIVSR